MPCSECETEICQIPYTIPEEEKERLRELWKSLENARNLISEMVQQNMNPQIIRKEVRRSLEAIIGCQLKMEELRVRLFKSKTKQIPLRVRKVYFDAIVKGEKTIEYRKYSDYWFKRLSEPHWGRERVAVFISGKRVHRRLITEVHHTRRPDNFSKQGKKDVPTESCFAIYLGREIRWCQCAHCDCDSEATEFMEEMCHYCLQFHTDGGE